MASSNYSTVKSPKTNEQIRHERLGGKCKMAVNEIDHSDGLQDEVGRDGIEQLILDTITAGISIPRTKAMCRVAPVADLCWLKVSVERCFIEDW